MEINNRDFDSKIIGKLKKIFHIEQNKNAPHIVYEIFYNGKKVARTYRSHGSGEMSDKAIFGVRRQLYVSMPQLKGLKNCPFTAQDYLDLLKEKNVISN